jgi:hypothetical protein
LSRLKLGLQLNKYTVAIDYTFGESYSHFGDTTSETSKLITYSYNRVIQKVCSKEETKGKLIKTWISTSQGAKAIW